ncbi:MAG TPA: GH25 family lysozyme [Streptosporangiaceae bacterium]|jgi:GH25 family lysozyme M1 (1,4-beta-N-acetylmuramidase)
MAAIAEGLDVSGFQGQFDWAAAVNAAPGLAFGAYRLTSGLGAAEPDARWNSDQIRAQRLYHGAFHLLDPRLNGALQAQAFIAAHARLGLSATDMLWLENTTAHKAGAAATAATALAFMRELDQLAPSNPRGVFSFTDFMKYGYCDGLGGYALWQAFPSAKAPHQPIPWILWSFWSWGARDGSTPTIFNGTAVQLASWLDSFSAPQAEEPVVDSKSRAIVSNAQLLQQLQILNKKADVLMSQQDEINADVQSIEAGVAALGTAEAAIQAEIASLKTANPALDLSGLDKAAADLTTAVAGVSAIAPPPAPAV